MIKKNFDTFLDICCDLMILISLTFTMFSVSMFNQLKRTAHITADKIEQWKQQSTFILYFWLIFDVFAILICLVKIGIYFFRRARKKLNKKKKQDEILEAHLDNFLKNFRIYLRFNREDPSET